MSIVRAARAATAAPAATPTRSSRRRSPACGPRSRATRSHPGAVTGGPGDPPRHEPGARETAFVENGGLTLHVDGAEHVLAAGDCVTFDADLPHHFANHTEEEAVLLAIVSAGLRRS